MFAQDTYKLAGVTCRFFDFRTYTDFNNWQWKLDPYKTPSVDSPDIQIRESISCKEISDKGVLQDSILLAEESAGFYVHRLYDRGNGHLIWNYEDSRSGDIMLSYDLQIDENRITLLSDNTNSGGTIAEEYLGRLLVPLFLKYDLLTIHGVLMEYEGKGIVISAPSGTGKTTHARMWRDYRNALIINGDRASLRKTDNIWYGYGLPWSGTSGEQINRKVAVRAIVVLERDTENRAEILDGIQAFAAFLPHVQAPVWNQDLSEHALDLTSTLLADLPVIRLRCRPDVEAVEVLEDILKDFL